MQIKGYFRDVKEADMELLFTWANDAETRRQSFSQSPITWEEHTAWFARTQADMDSPHWIFMAYREEDDAETANPADGPDYAEAGCFRGEGAKCVKKHGEPQPAGVLRLTKGPETGTYRISYSIAPTWRGCGCGSLLLTLAKKWAAAMCVDCTELYGEVKAENIASVRCFEEAGYEREADGEVLRFCTVRPGKTLIYFRADANGQVGYGHLMRCFTIADACESQGLYPAFVTAQEETREVIIDRGFPCQVLETDYRNMESELIKLRKLLADGAPVVLDSYYLTKPYVETLKENGHRVVWMDDLGEQKYPADMVINYNIYAKQLAYPAGQKEKYTYLLGPDYAPVRPFFRRENCTVREKIGTILVTTGGSDSYGAGIWLTELLAELLPGTKILVVCGPYVESKEKLYRLSEENEHIELIEGCSDLSQVMRKSDFAVAAAGSTLYELCAVGLPSIVYYVADNQRPGAEAFARETGAVNLGDIRTAGFREEAAARLSMVLTDLAAASGRQKLADAMHALVDGNGAGRIAEALAKLVFMH